MGVENLDRSAVGVIEVNPGSGWRALGIIREETVRMDGKELTHLDVSDYPIGVDKTIFGNVSVEIEFVWEEIADIDLWNLVLHGGAMTTTTAGTQAVTNESVVLKATDWVALAHAADFAFDCAVTVTDQEESTTYAEGIDYYLDRRGGHLRRIAGGTISEGQTVYVDYGFTTFSGKHFEIFADPAPAIYAIRLTKPLMNGDNLRITHSKVCFSTTTELPLRPGEEGVWAGVAGKIRLLKDAGGPYGVHGRWEIYTP